MNEPEPSPATSRASAVQQDLAGLRADVDRVAAELRTQGLQLAGMIALITMVGAMVWIVSKQIEGLT